MAVGGLALLGPAIGNTFSTIVNQLQATGTPPPTPTPVPTASPSSIVQQAQPLLQQVATVFGVSVDQLFQDLSGEYAVALFPAPGDNLLHIPGASGAIWIQSDDAAGLVGLVNTGLGNVGTLSSRSHFTSHHTTVNGVDVTFWADTTGSDLLSVGQLDDHVMFVAPAQAAQVVTAVHGNGVAQSANWPGTVVSDLGSGGEALLYLDPGALAQTRGAHNTPGQGLGIFQNIVAGLDLRDNGLFVLRMTGVLQQR
jgi:hypothetical protein